MLLAVLIISATIVISIIVIEHYFPKCVHFGINEGHAVLKIPSWSLFYPCFPRIVYEFMLFCRNSQGN